MKYFPWNMSLTALFASLAACRAPSPPSGTTADSAAAAGFHALIATAPGAARYCLAIGNPAIYRDPTSGVPTSFDASPSLLALVDAGRPPAAAPLAGLSACGSNGPSASDAEIVISHLLPLGDDVVHITATVMSRDGDYDYACRVQRRRAHWSAAQPCRLTGMSD
jgi:hypothetical protein